MGCSLAKPQVTETSDSVATKLCRPSQDGPHNKPSTHIQVEANDRRGSWPHICSLSARTEILNLLYTRFTLGSLAIYAALPIFPESANLNRLPGATYFSTETTSLGTHYESQCAKLACCADLQTWQSQGAVSSNSKIAATLLRSFLLFASMNIVEQSCPRSTYVQPQDYCLLMDESLQFSGFQAQIPN